MENRDTGFLLNGNNLKLHRKYFENVVRLSGINIQYQAPAEDAHYDTSGDLWSKYWEPITIGCLFNDNPDQKTMKKLGWNAELDSETRLVTVAYDTPKLCAGALFTLPAAIDGAPGRVFRVIRMSTSAIYPSSVTCELAPEYNSIFDTSSVHNPEDSKYISDGPSDEGGEDFLYLKNDSD